MLSWASVLEAPNTSGACLPIVMGKQGRPGMPLQPAGAPGPCLTVPDLTGMDSRQAAAMVTKKAL